MFLSRLSCVVALLALLMLVGCGAAPAIPAVATTASPPSQLTATSTLSPITETAAIATLPQASPTPTRIPPTSTPPPPSPTPTPRPPTATPIPPTATVVPTATSTPVPEAQIILDQLNLRQGPGTDFPIDRQLSQGETVALIGQIAGCNWLQIETSDGQTGWVSGDAQYVSFAGPCQDIPLGYYRPLTGLLKRDAPAGEGGLVIRNGTDRDGMVVLAYLSDDMAVAAYIRSGDSFEMSSIPDGTFRLYFSKGDDWDGEANRFSRNASYQRFEDPLEFQTTATQYTWWEVTLYGVVGGTAATETVDPEDFPVLD